MKKIGEFFKNNRYLFLTLGLTLIVMGVIFTCRGIYPFGEDPFVVYDFDSGYVPVYYKLWDVLHGVGTVLFDWNLGAGLNSYGSLISNSLIMPSSLIIGMFARNFVPYAMSFVMIAKMLVVALCTYIAFSKLFPKTHGIYKCFFTLNYVFCGWTAFMYSNILYLDVFALFPLFVLSLYRLLKDNKWGMYVIVLTLCLLLNYYMSYLILFFIIGTTVIALCTLELKDKKKKAVEVVLLTLLSLGLSCVLFLPGFGQSTSSYRMSNGGGDPVPYLAETFLKLIYMAPMVIPFYFTFKQLMVKKDKKINIFFILLLIYLLIGIFVPKINAMWHTGSYSGFPFRYSFIPSFILTLISLYYIDKNYKNKNDKKLVNIIGSIILMIIVVVLAVIYRKEYLYFSFVNYVSTYSQFFCIVLLFIISIITLIIIMKNDKKVTAILLAIFTLVQVSIYGTYFTVNYEKEYNNTLVTEEINKNFKIPNDNYNVVDRIGILNVNFPYILNRPSMENRLHFIKKEEIDFSRYMGYEGNDTFIYSNGGTLFSNLLMQNKYYITDEKLNEKLYTLLDSKDNYYLYETKYNLNYIIPYSGKILNKGNNVLVNNTNNLYKTLFNKEEDILHLVEDKEVTLEPGKVYYIYSYSGYVADLFEKLEGKIEDMSNVNSYDIYISEITLTEKVKINTEEYEDFRLAYIDIDEYIDFVKGINDYEVKVKIDKNTKIYDYKAKEDTSILIPVNYDDSLVVKVNGKEVKYELNAYNMLSIDVKKGNNKIEVTYIPKFFKEGIMISLISLGIFIVIWLTNKKFHYLDHKFILYPLFLISALIGFGFILKIYILFWL